MRDSFHLQRFIDAQQAVYQQVLAELRNGRKTSHWMWFVFPQIRGLGHSSIAQHYAIRSKEEAAAYLGHPILGPRLRECTRIINTLMGRTATDVFGPIDAMKFRSSMTLFAAATPDNEDFRDALRTYFGGEADPLTMDRLSDAGAEVDTEE